MKRWLLIAVISLIVICGAGIAWQSWHGPADPVYQGHPLSVWLRGLGPQTSDIAGRPEAEEALHDIGTNAIPMLLSMLRAEDSEATLASLALAQKQSLFNFDYFPAK